MLGNNISSWTSSAVMAVLGGSGFVGWMRERRKSRTGQAESMLNFVKEWGDQFKEQNRRIDDLNREVGQLTGRLAQQSEQNQHLLAENTALKVEIVRLTTALQTEQNKALALEHMPRAPRSTDFKS